jgi:hypothetical protein
MLFLLRVRRDIPPATCEDHVAVVAFFHFPMTLTLNAAGHKRLNPAFWTDPHAEAIDHPASPET